MNTHKHDYHMFFENPECPLRYTLRCDCGKVARDMPTALKDMRNQMQKSPTWMVVVAAVLAAGFVAILAAIHPHPAIPAIPEVHSSKGDMEHHIRIIQIDRPPVIEDKPQPVKAEVPQPFPWPVDPPVVHKTQPVVKPVAQNVCERTGGRKVETNGGRSWHCEYNHRN
jgi:hypothetical protein